MRCCGIAAIALLPLLQAPGSSPGAGRAVPAPAGGTRNYLLEGFCWSRCKGTAGHGNTRLCRPAAAEAAEQGGPTRIRRGRAACGATDEIAVGASAPAQVRADASESESTCVSAHLRVVRACRAPPPGRIDQARAGDQGRCRTAGRRHGARRVQHCGASVAAGEGHGGTQRRRPTTEALRHGPVEELTKRISGSRRGARRSRFEPAGFKLGLGRSASSASKAGWFQGNSSWAWANRLRQRAESP